MKKIPYTLRHPVEAYKAYKRTKWPVVDLDHPENNCNFCGCDHHYGERIYGVTPEAREELGEKDNFWTWAYIISLLLLTVMLMEILPWRT